MQSTHSQLPEVQALTAVLTSLFANGRSVDSQLAALERQPNVYASTSPSEILTCRFENGRELGLFCKYSTDEIYESHGHRGDLAYEAEVYRHVLEPLELSRPGFYGAHTDASGQTSLFLQHLEGNSRVGKLPHPTAMSLAARWIGQFHAFYQAQLPGAAKSFLNRYSAEYYLGWARRTEDFTADLHDRFPWFPTLRERFPHVVDHLLQQAPTVIHGEYYSHNVLFCDGEIYPVDWQSAAIGVGEIDLAALTEAWPAEIADQCVSEYQEARWPAGSPADFPTTLDAARIYLHFRWLGDPADCSTLEDRVWHLEQLQAVAARLGLV